MSFDIQTVDVNWWLERMETPGRSCQMGSEAVHHSKGWEASSDERIIHDQILAQQKLFAIDVEVVAVAFVEKLEPSL